LADADTKRAREVAARINRLRGDKKVKAVSVDAASQKAAAKLMKGHDAALSAVPYFLNLGLVKAGLVKATLPTWAETTQLAVRNWRCRATPRNAG
jgi:saccharopine dehydrogenase-like NADP-dependent oxidoreductase